MFWFKLVYSYWVFFSDIAVIELFEKSVKINSYFKSSLVNMTSNLVLQFRFLGIKSFQVWVSVRFMTSGMLQQQFSSLLKLGRQNCWQRTDPNRRRVWARQGRNSGNSPLQSAAALPKLRSRRKRAAGKSGRSGTALLRAMLLLTSLCSSRNELASASAPTPTT